MIFCFVFCFSFPSFFFFFWWSGCRSLNILKYVVFCFYFTNQDSTFITCPSLNHSPWPERQAHWLVSVGHMTTQIGRRVASLFTDLSGRQELGRMQSRRTTYVYYTHPCVIPFLLRKVIVVTKLIPSGSSSVPFLFCQLVRIFSWFSLKQRQQQLNP